MSSPFIVVPTYHELDNLPKFTERLWQAVPDARILLVDDASGDGTPAWVKTHPRYNKSLFLLERAGKLGLGTAYVDGFAWVIQRHATEPCSAVVQMDADMSHDPNSVPDLLRKLKEGADLVLATRYLGGVRVTNWPLRRLLLSLGAGQYVKWITWMPFSDPTGGFKAFRPEKLAVLDFSQIHSDGYAFQIEVTHMAWMLGWKIDEVPIVSKIDTQAPPRCRPVLFVKPSGGFPGSRCGDASSAQGPWLQKKPLHEPDNHCRANSAG